MKNVELITFVIVFLSFTKNIHSENAKLTVELINSGFHR